MVEYHYNSPQILIHWKIQRSAICNFSDHFYIYSCTLVLISGIVASLILMRQLQITCTNLLLLVCKLSVCRLIHDDIDTLLIDKSGCKWAGGGGGITSKARAPLIYMKTKLQEQTLYSPFRYLPDDADTGLISRLGLYLIGETLGNYHRSCCPSNTKETTPNYIVYSYYS